MFGVGLYMQPFERAAVARQLACRSVVVDLDIAACFVANCAKNTRRQCEEAYSMLAGYQGDSPELLGRVLRLTASKLELMLGSTRFPAKDLYKVATTVDFVEGVQEIKVPVTPWWGSDPPPTTLTRTRPLAAGSPATAHPISNRYYGVIVRKGDVAVSNATHATVLDKTATQYILDAPVHAAHKVLPKAVFHVEDAKEKAQRLLSSLVDGGWFDGGVPITYGREKFEEHRVLVLSKMDDVLGTDVGTITPMSRAAKNLQEWLAGLNATGVQTMLASADWSSLVAPSSGLSASDIAEGHLIEAVSAMPNQYEDTIIESDLPPSDYWRRDNE